MTKTSKTTKTSTEKAEIRLSDCFEQWIFNHDPFNGPTPVVQPDPFEGVTGFANGGIPANGEFPKGVRF